MPSVTYKFDFNANNKLEIETKIKEKISTYIGTEVENPLRYVNYEAVVTDSDIKGTIYNVQVIARIKNDNK